MSRRVFVIGYGMITSIGKDATENYQSLLNRKCGFGKIDILDTLHHDDLPACEIKLTDQELCIMANVPDGKGFARPALLSAIAIEEAIRRAGLAKPFPSCTLAMMQSSWSVNFISQAGKSS